MSAFYLALNLADVVVFKKRTLAKQQILVETELQYFHYVVFPPYVSAFHATIYHNQIFVSKPLSKPAARLTLS